MLVSRIPEITAEISLGLQRAVHEAGEQVEFLVAQKVGPRRKTGQEQSGVRWRPGRADPFRGQVVASTFYTKFSEYGTVHQSAHPALGPSADEARPAFTRQAVAATRRAAR